MEQEYVPKPIIYQLALRSEEHTRLWREFGELVGDYNKKKVLMELIKKFVEEHNE